MIVAKRQVCVYNKYIDGVVKVKNRRGLGFGFTTAECELREQ